MFNLDNRLFVRKSLFGYSLMRLFVRKGLIGYLVNRLKTLRTLRKTLRPLRLRKKVDCHASVR